MYGIDLEIFSFKHVLEHDKNAMFFMNGSMFNLELKNDLDKLDKKYIMV